MNPDPIRKTQVQNVIRPVVYGLLLAFNNGLTTNEICGFCDRIPGLNKYKLSDEKIRWFLTSYTSKKGLSVFIKREDTWLIRSMVGGYKC
jgi:hypothetical protein